MKFNLRKIIFYVILLLTINIITNYNYFYQFLYQDKEVVYNKSDFKVDENIYEITNINKKVSVIKLNVDDANDVIIQYTSDNFINYNHPNM